jgi:ribosomal protein S2
MATHDCENMIPEVTCHACSHYHTSWERKCFEGIMTHNIPDCLVIMNANENSMAKLEVNQLQIPTISLVDSNISNKLQKVNNLSYSNE